MPAQHALTTVTLRSLLSSTPEQDLLSRLPVGVVVVDRCYHIQTINSAAQRLLSIYGAALGEDLIHLAQTVPGAPLRAAIDAAIEGAAPTSLDEAIQLLQSGDAKLPLVEPSEDADGLPHRVGETVDRGK